MKSFDISGRARARVHALRCETVGDARCKYQFPQLHIALCRAKDQIQLYSTNWDKRKKLINDFERVYRYPRCRDNLINFNPISRAFFKMWEMLHIIDLPAEPITVVCLAEAPGGFIEAIRRKRGSVDVDRLPLGQPSILPAADLDRLPAADVVHAITLNATTDTIPSFASAIDFVKHVGDLTVAGDIDAFVASVGAKAQLITADGGFDIGDAYDDQEILFQKLFAGEVLAALALQARGGTFVIKVFDLLSCFSVSLVFLLTQCYGRVRIYKPDFSRAGNSERYLICENFLDNDNCRVVSTMLKTALDREPPYKIRCLFIRDDFMRKMNWYNVEFCNEQMAKINQVIELSKINFIDKDLLVAIKRRQYNCSLVWCEKYGL